VAESRIDELRRRVARDPGSRLFAQLAEEERKAGDLGEAIRVARAGLAVHPAYPAALLTLGRALLDSGDGDGARAALQDALKQAPDNILASRFLGQALEAVGDLEGALRQYGATLKMAPGDRQLEGRVRGLERRLAQARRAAPVAPAGTPTGPTRRMPQARPGVGPVGGSGATEGRRTGGPPIAAERPPAQSGAHAPGPPLTREAGAAGDVAAQDPRSGARVASEAGETTGGEGPPFSSSTLAELYLRQGFAARAVEVYRQVVAEHPGDERARTRLTELASLQATEAAGGARDTPEGRRRRSLQRTIAGLEVLLGVARRR
jgi:tetratricopeptide (TPR) repeat protein